MAAISRALMAFTLVLIAASLSSIGIRVQASPDYYRAALLEHVRWGDFSDHPPQEIVEMNLKMYKKAAEVAASKGVDIIVFPEYGIFPPQAREKLKDFLEQTPDPRKVTTNPCEQEVEFSDKPILYTLSCMAKRHNMVVVANTGDIQPCVPRDNSSCPEDGVLHLNALVAFNRDGTLISRYHKVHLFYELGMDLPREPQNSTFETDFGTFAMFICFDAIFEDIVRAAKEVDNIILSTMWADPMPFMNSVQFFQALALGNNVTYLASNIQRPPGGAVGSGMFSGHFGAIKYTYNPDGLSKLIVSRVPKSKHATGPFPNPDSSITVITENGTEEYDEDKDGEDVPDECSWKFWGDPKSWTKYRCMQEKMINYTLVKLSELSDNLEVCNNGMCCSLSYSAASMNESYFFGVYNGTHSMFDRYFFCEENCLLIRCDAFNGTICDDFRLRSNTVFDRVHITANFTTEYVYPSVMKSSMRLAPVDEWTHHLQQQGDVLSGHLMFRKSSSKPLLFAGLFGRCYDRDPPYVR